jgi:DNA-binding transcriptional LysR family regulator
LPSKTPSAWFDNKAVSLMEFRHLRSFLALADELHFGRAAEALGIAQPALSRHIQQLETEVGVSLVERGAGVVKLTPAGEVLRARSRPQLEGLAAAVAEARAVGAGRDGRLTIGFVTSMSFAFLPRVLERLRREAPTAFFDVHEVSVEEADRAVRAERFDVGLTRLPVGDQGLIQRALYDEPLVFALPAEHRLASRTEFSLGEVAEEPFVMCQRPDRSTAPHIILQRCAEAGFQPRVVQEVSGKTLMMELVAAGLGMTIVPASASLSPRPGVVYRWSREPLAPVRMGAVWRRENVNPLLRVFLDVAVEVARKLGPELAERGRPEHLASAV